MTETSPSEIPPKTPVTRGVPRWMWISLVLSIALNLLVIGMAAAAFVHLRGKHEGPGSKMVRFLETLPAERQAKLRAMLDERRSRFRPLRRQLRQARRRARDAFVAEPYDRDALVGAYADAAKARMALTEARQQWFENMAQVLTRDERQKFLKMRHRRHRFRERR